MSMKLRLFLILTLASLAVWVSAVVWIEKSTRAQVERVLDARLIEAARMVSSLVANNRVALAGAGPAPIRLPESGDYAHQQFCQIWSLSGQLVGRSDGAPGDRLLSFSETGFHEVTRAGEALRVYAVVDPALGVQVTVGDSLAVRDRLVRDVIEGVLLPAIVMLPVMAALIWVAAAGGLRPLERLAAQLAGRTVEDRAPVSVEGPIPAEIRPVVQALNDLLARLDRARARERDFVAYAAHEMKTPLAGLQAQAYVARRAEDAETRARALEAIEASVQRTDRLVRQLLDLAQVEHEAPRWAPLDLAALAHQQIAGLAPLADRHRVVLELVAPPAARVQSDGVLLGLALRNLLENAIQASPAGGRVTLVLAPETEAGAGGEAGGGVEVRVADDGPGLPPEIAAQATGKFVKGASGPPQGSGLGLAITEDALATLGAALRFQRLGARHVARFVLPAGPVAG